MRGSNFYVRGVMRGSKFKCAAQYFSARLNARLSARRSILVRGSDFQCAAQIFNARLSF